jgi:NAD(P)-dependent dehydrogenase (short-subunit alcohol dehydrogenase family)
VNTILPGLTDTEMVRRLAGTEALPESVWQVGAAQVRRSTTVRDLATRIFRLPPDKKGLRRGLKLMDWWT